MAILSKGCKIYLSLIWKDSSTHMHGLAVYLKEGLSFTQNSSLENSADSYLWFYLALLRTVTYFFFLINHLLHLWAWFLILFDEILLINPSVNVFAFGGFSIHHIDWLTYSGRNDRPGELCYNFSISNDLTEVANFPTRIPGCNFNTFALLDLFPSSDTSICSTMAFHSLRNSDHVLVTFSFDLTVQLMPFVMLIWTVFVII